MERVVLHFLDSYHFELAQHENRHPLEIVRTEAAAATRLALMFASTVYLPASVVFENQEARTIVLANQAFSEAGDLILVARDASVSEHFERKQHDHYDDRSPENIRMAYETTLAEQSTPYVSVPIELASSIRLDWRKSLDSDNLPAWYLELARHSNVDLRRADDLWNLAIGRVEGRALVVPHLQETFADVGLLKPRAVRLLSHLDPAFVRAHTDPLGAGFVSELIFLKTPWDSTLEGAGSLDFRRLRSVLQADGLWKPFLAADAERAVQLKRTELWQYYRNCAEDDNKAAADREAIDEIEDALADTKVSKRQRAARVPAPTIGVVTALPVEWAMVNAALGAEQMDAPEGDPNLYSQAIIAGRRVIATLLPRMGTNSAASVSASLLRSFPTVTDLIFSGIACGCPSPGSPQSHVRLGDVVVSDRRGVVQTDHQVIREGSTESRSSLAPPSRRLLNAVRVIQTREYGTEPRWWDMLDELISSIPSAARPAVETDILLSAEGEPVQHPADDGRRPGYPRVFYGPVGSSNSLIRDQKLREELAKEFGLLALEMEGSGLAEAAWHSGANYLLVRGISDYGDNRTKNDAWHAYAAAAAAAYVRDLLSSLPATVPKPLEAS